MTTPGRFLFIEARKKEQDRKHKNVVHNHETIEADAMLSAGGDVVRVHTAIIWISATDSSRYRL